MILRRLSLLWRIRLLTASIVALVTLFGLAVAIYERVDASRREFQDSANSIVLALMPMLRNTLVVGDLATAQQTLDAIIQQESVSRIALLSPKNGKTMVEASDPMASVRHNAPPAWFVALTGVRPLVSAESIVVGGTDYGTLRLEMSGGKLVRQLWRSAIMFVGVGLLCLIGVVVIMGIALRRGLAPLQLLTDGARRVGRGDWSERIPAVEVPEIAVVANAFNQMADTLSQREADLVRAKEAAEAANRAKATFLGTMSHELRTPLNGIMGMTELALTTDPTDEQRGYLDLAKTSADTLLAILNDILDFSNIDSGQVALTSMPLNLKDIALDVVSQFAFRCRNKHVETAVTLTPDPPPLLLGDGARIGQVLTNLYGNAVKFTQSGSISLSVAVTPADSEYYRVDIAVADTGIGIAPADLDRIFDPFSQADGSITRRFGGAGLGLAISRRLVELMGGEIAVGSELAKGSTFTVRLRLPAGNRVP